MDQDECKGRLKSLRALYSRAEEEVERLDPILRKRATRLRWAFTVWSTSERKYQRLRRLIERTFLQIQAIEKGGGE